MVKIGNFFFHYRNGLFPLAYLLVLLPSPGIFADDNLALAAGVFIAFCGQALRALTIGLAYIKRGGLDRRVYAEDLVTDGIFAHCRNPLYDGNILMILGLAVAINSLWSLVISTVFFLFAYRAIVAAEEAFLARKFGGQYTDYCRRVPRFAIRMKGLGDTMGSMEFRWRRLIVKEYGTTFAWIVGLVLALYLRRHIFGSNHDFSLRIPLDAVLAATLFAAAILYSIARFLKKTRRLQAD
jgi:protein-S-isoprenylcysteine O-methyltransferase Ste14